jgi:CMP-N,N'-diacetyllegionaminic acid synthase
MPLIHYTTDLALSCDLFSAVVVSTDYTTELTGTGDPISLEVHQRKPEHATDDAPDFLWVQDVMQGRTEELFCILRPTSPFRTVSTIRRAYALLIGSGADSVRAVRPVKEHPGKVWQASGRYIVPVLNEWHANGTPWHSSPTQTLPRMYVQNASLEMAWSHVLWQTKTISGQLVAPFFTDPIEGFDINTPEDFAEAEAIAARWPFRSPTRNLSGVRGTSP